MGFKQGKSINDVNKKIDRLVNVEMPKKIESELYKMGTNLGAESDYYVPTETTNLIGSRYQRVGMNGTKYQLVLGYDKRYAGPLHSPAPGGKMDGWKPRPVPSPGKLKGSYNANAKQNWLNVAWAENSSWLLDDFSQDIIK